MEDKAQLNADLDNKDQQDTIQTSDQNLTPSPADLQEIEASQEFHSEEVSLDDMPADELSALSETDSQEEEQVLDMPADDAVASLPTTGNHSEEVLAELQDQMEAEPGQPFAFQSDELPEFLKEDGDEPVLVLYNEQDQQEKILDEEVQEVATDASAENLDVSLPLVTVIDLAKDEVSVLEMDDKLAQPGEMREEPALEPEVSVEPAGIESADAPMPEPALEPEVSVEPAGIESADAPMPEPDPEASEAEVQELAADKDAETMEPPSLESEKEADTTVEPDTVTEKEDDAEKDASDKEEVVVELEEEEEEEVPGEDILEDPLETEDKYQILLREELVEAMEGAVSHDDISKVKRRISMIRVAFLNKTRDEKSLRFEKFIEEGGEKEAYSEAPDALEERFRLAFATYKDKKASWEVEQERIRHQNLVVKQQILEQLKELISSEESLKKTYDEFRELQEKWSQIGMVPRTENNNLWQNYHFLVEKFFDKVKINRELRDLDLKRNLESKVALCEKVEELLLETSVDRSFRLLQQYHREWKEIGPVPMDKKDEVWERFKRISDLINDKRREYYDQRQEEMDNNLLAKKELCEQAETISSSEMTSIKHWQDNTLKINEMFKIWKAIGPAPRVQNDAIWNRFRSVMEAFFAAKKEYFDKLKDEQVNNYNLKLDLCVQAESLKFSTDWRKTSQELINLQKRWKEIGPVPRKHSDKIWKRFRAACDEFFSAKSAHFSNLQGHESDNLRLKDELIKRIEAYSFNDDKSDNLETLKGFQREWMEIGHVPMSEKDRVQKAFREVIDRKLKELNISSYEIVKPGYRARSDSPRDQRDGGRPASKEKGFLQNKISALQEEINLWENNLGFFAESKKAQILKEEFSRKIEKAKQEVALLEAKLKLLREAE